MRILVVLFCFLSSCLSSQNSKIFNNWHFSRNAWLNFNTSPPKFFGGSAIFTIEGSSSISDSLGNLLFYTDGISVWNKNHQLMPNGFGLNGHVSSTQSALIVPFITNPNKYYIFTADAQVGQIGGCTCGCLAYSVVDMTQQSGLGDITIKKVKLYDSIAEKLHGVKIENDSSIWVVAHEWNTNNFLSFRLNPSGIDTVPVISSTGSVHSGDVNLRNSAGQMKISPDGTKLACVTYFAGQIELFHFNKSTGEVSDPIQMLGDQFMYGVEFSPNSALLYVTNNWQGYLWQFDVSNWNVNAITASKKEIFKIGGGDPFGQLQLGPDGRIYTTLQTSFTVAAINQPDKLGLACDLSTFIELKDTNNVYGTAREGLPNMIAGFYKTDYIPPDPNPEGLIENIPNVFSPNGDDVNELWQVKLPAGSLLNRAVIYDRWGISVYDLTGTQLKQPSGAVIRWDGFTTSGVPCSDGVYFYIIEYIDKINNFQKLTGYLSLFR